TPPRPRGLHPRGRIPAKVTSHIFEGRNSMYAPIPLVISSVGEKWDFIAQSANKDYKGLPRRSHRKIQTRCHLRGNFPRLGEEQETKKGTEPLADATTRLLGMREAAPRPHGSSGTLSSQAFF